jgi:hypothetical protein
VKIKDTVLTVLNTAQPNLKNGISWEARKGVYDATIGLIDHIVYQELNISVDNLEILDDVDVLQ